MWLAVVNPGYRPAAAVRNRPATARSPIVRDMFFEFADYNSLSQKLAKTGDRRDNDTNNFYDQLAQLRDTLYSQSSLYLSSQLGQHGGKKKKVPISTREAMLEMPLT